jgi:hypothetical protein
MPPEKTDRPRAIPRDEKDYFDLSGRIEEPSAAHKYHYYMAAIKSGGFAVVTGLISAETHSLCLPCLVCETKLKVRYSHPVPSPQT